MAEHPENPEMGVDHQSDMNLEATVGHASVPGSPPNQIELLLKTVESELIPRLFVSHLMDIPATSPLVENRATEPSKGPWCSDDKVQEFAELCISNDPQVLDQHVTDLLAQGVTLESVFLFLLEPVARYLGDRWLRDEVSFVDVHLGLCRLHQLICECETIGYASENLATPGQSVLLTCAPGENHTFGVTMVADFFRRYGWQVSNLCGLDTDFLLARLSSTYYSVVGFSLHNDYNYDELAKTVAEVKAKAVNPDLVVMVGGDHFIRNPKNVQKVGADIFATNGREAVLKAESASKLRGRPVL